MKKVIILSVIAIALVLGACNNSSTKNEQTNPSNAAQQFNIDTTKLKTGEVFYQCEMHSEVTSDKPGSCPKCGMDLEKVVKQ